MDAPTIPRPVSAAETARATMRLSNLQGLGYRVNPAGQCVRIARGRAGVRYAQARTILEHTDPEQYAVSLFDRRW